VGAGIEAEPICRAMNRSWMSAVEMEKRLILQRLYLESVTGVDSSPEMIAYATRTYASKQYQTFLSLVMHVPLILIKI